MSEENTASEPLVLENTAPDPVVLENTAPDPVVIEPTAPLTEGTLIPREKPPEIKRLRDSHGKHYVLINGTLRSIEAKVRESKKERLRRRKANKKE